MTSYGEPHAGEYDDDYYRPSYPPRPAPEPGYGDDGGYRRDDAGYGRENAYGNDDFGAGQPISPASGRASVPGIMAPPPGAPGAFGRATVPSVSGRATVRPAGPPRPGGPVGPGGPDGPQGPGGPKGFLSKLGKGGKKGKKGKRRWRNIILASTAVFILLVGGGLIGGTYFYDDIKEPKDLKLKLSTEIFSSDGQQIAKMGSENRIDVPMSTLKKNIKDTLIAGEDKNFYSHSGIDLWGIGRAAWNNLTGGETQGASTITQQYARAAAEDMEVTYARKLREAVMARKLEDKYDKETILGFYLSTVYFGRGAYGIGAAAKAYFDKEAKDLSPAQAAVLGAVLKQPEGKTGFDPYYNLGNAKGRWSYVLDNAVEMQAITAQERAAIAATGYPEKELKVYNPSDTRVGEWGYTNSSTGHVINYVYEELAQMGAKPGDLLKELQATGRSWKDSGLRITTTINYQAQRALELSIDRSVKGSLLNDPKTPANLMGAAVAIDPKTGRVLAYFGGRNGTGVDYAGKNAEGTEWEAGGHPPASSFKIYTLVAALKNGYSFKSHINANPMKKASDQFDVANAGREGSAIKCAGGAGYCTLAEATTESLNVPFFKIAQDISPQEVVKAANQAGVTTMWSTRDGKAKDISKAENIGTDNFFYHVGYGQYPITVLDHASGTATIANGGTYSKPHFVLKVERRATTGKKAGQWEVIPGASEKLVQKKDVFGANSRDITNEITTVLQKVSASRNVETDNGEQEAARKTGTWENGQPKLDAKGKVIMKNGKPVPKYPGQNAHAWFVGYTPSIATAVWVGNVKDELPIKDKNGGKIGGSKLPGDIWEKFMSTAYKGMNLKKADLADVELSIGDENKGDGISPTPGAPCWPGWPGCPGVPDPTTTPGGGGGGWPRPTPTKTRR